MLYSSGPAGPEEKIVAAVDRAIGFFKLCPNRIWGIAGGLPGRETNLPNLIPPAKELGQPSTPHEDHRQCTFDMCEYSRRDFTSVPQRHEPSYCGGESCALLIRRFPRSVLEQAILEATSERGSSTAWKLDGFAMLEPFQPYMAISHVWSDGTGVGAWDEGNVNKCLYSFFKKVAKIFHCEGIWWDTLCIPRNKAARSKAIPRIQSHYEDATVTVVHDCFLRNWTWTDAGAACFAIVMSPWFSRGWTALELAKSRKVKVLFKAPQGSGIFVKDLDEDILAPFKNVSDHDHHRDGQLAAKTIAYLRRQNVTTLNSLLSVLGPRHTSWPRDMAVISGLLTGVDVNDVTQQGIYQRILSKLGTVFHGHLFHSSATMSSSFTWCPTSLLDLPVTPPPETEAADTVLRIGENGVAVGRWKAVRITAIPEESYVWNDTHPLIKARIRLTLMDEAKHVLLVENQTVSFSRALVVKVMKRNAQQTGVPVRFIGPVSFQPPQTLGPQVLSGSQLPDGVKSWVSVNARIGDTEKMEDIEGDAWLQLVKWNEDFPDARIAYTIGVKRELAERGVTRYNKRIKGPKDRDRALFQASLDGDKEEVLRLLKDGANPNIRDKCRQTPLHCATWRGHSEVVELLIRLGNADRNIQDKLGRLAIHLAAERGDRQILKLLLNGADINHKCRNGQTVLHCAASGGAVDVVDMLLTKTNLDRDAEDEQWQTALFIAARMGYNAIVDRLLRSGVDTDTFTVRKRTALHEAAIKGHCSIIRLLLHHKARTDIKDSRQRLPLHWAVRYQREEAAKLLIPVSDLGARDGKNKTALFMATKNGCTSIIPLLMQSNACDPAGKPLLHWAVRKGHVEVLETLLSCSDPDIQDADGQTALHLAVQQGHYSMIELLLQAGVSRTIQDSSLCTPMDRAMVIGDVAAVKRLLDYREMNIGPFLLRAAGQGYTGVIRLLLEVGNADISMTVNNDGQTPLMLAVINGHEEAVKLLLEKSYGDIGREDRNGDTPISEAVRRRFKRIAVLLVKASTVAINLEDQLYRRTLLHWAAEEGSTIAVNSLLTTGAGTDVRDDDGRTPLSWAAGGGHEDVVRLLLGNSLGEARLSEIAECKRRTDGSERSVDLNSRDNAGRTPLSWAAGNGHGTIVGQLLAAGAYLFVGAARDQTPLYWAAKNGHETIFEQLLKLAIATNIDGQRFDLEMGKILFGVAAENGHVPILEQLYSYSTGTEQEGWPPCGAALRLAAKMGHEAVIKLLQDRNPKPWEYEREFLTNEDIRDALQLASENGRGAAFKRLYSRETLRIGQGEGLLFTAAEKGHAEIVKLILARKDVNPNYTSSAGRTALSLAAENGHEETVKQFLSRPEVNPNLTDENGQTPLSLAAEKGHCETVKEFLFRGDVNITLANRRGAPPLVFAAENRHKAIVMLLLAAEGLDLGRDLGIHRPSYVDGSVHSEDSVSFDSADEVEDIDLWDSADDTSSAMVGVCKAVLDLYESDGECRIVRRERFNPEDEGSD